MNDMFLIPFISWCCGCSLIFIIFLQSLVRAWILSHYSGYRFSDVWTRCAKMFSGVQL